MVFSIYTPINIKPRFYLSIILVFATSFIDLFGGSLVVPTLRQYTRYFGANEFEHGIIFVAYFVSQTISAVVMGYLSDLFGRKPLLIWSLIGSSFGHLFQALCEDKWTFFVARLFTGGLAGSLTVSLAYISDAVKKEDRDKWISRLYATTCVSWVIGPVISTAVISIHLKFPLYLSFGASFIVLVVSWIFMSDSKVFIKHTETQHEIIDIPSNSQIPSQSLNETVYDEKNSINNVDNEINHQTCQIEGDISINTLSPITIKDETNSNIRESSTRNEQTKVENNDVTENYIQTKQIDKLEDHQVKTWELPYIKNNMIIILIFTIFTSFLNWSCLTTLDLLFPFYADDVGNLSSFVVGLGFSLQSLIMALVLFFMVPFLSRYLSYLHFWILFSPLTVLISLLMVLFFESSFVNTLCLIIVGATVTPLISCTSITVTLISSPDKQGYYLSFTNTAESISRIVVPLFYSYLYGVNYKYPYYCQLGILMIL